MKVRYASGDAGREVHLHSSTSHNFEADLRSTESLQEWDLWKIGRYSNNQKGDGIFCTYLTIAFSTSAQCNEFIDRLLGLQAAQIDAEIADKVAIKAIIIGQNPSEDTGSVISRESKIRLRLCAAPIHAEHRAGQISPRACLVQPWGPP
jgi:hypothetical protein